MTVTIDSEAPGARRAQTLGEYRVGIGFNPSGDPSIDHLKRLGAAFIDACEDLKNALPKVTSGSSAGEVLRLIALAQTNAEDAAMWAVKAATKKPR